MLKLLQCVRFLCTLPARRTLNFLSMNMMLDGLLVNVGLLTVLNQPSLINKQLMHYFLKLLILPYWQPFLNWEGVTPQDVQRFIIWQFLVTVLFIFRQLQFILLIYTHQILSFASHCVLVQTHLLAIPQDWTSCAAQCFDLSAENVNSSCPVLMLFIRYLILLVPQALIIEHVILILWFFLKLFCVMDTLVSPCLNTFSHQMLYIQLQQVRDSPINGYTFT